MCWLPLMSPSFWRWRRTAFHRYVLVYLYRQAPRRCAISPKRSSPICPAGHGAVADVQRGRGRRAHHPRHLPDRLSAGQAGDPGARRQHRPLRRDRPQGLRGMGRQGLSHQVHPPRPTARATRPARWPTGSSRPTASSSPSSTPTSFPRATSSATSCDYFTDAEGRHGAGPLGPPQPRRLAADPQPGDLPRRALRHRAHRPQSLRPIHALQRHGRRLAPDDHRRCRRLAARHAHRRPRPVLSRPDEGLAVRLPAAVCRARRSCRRR